MANSKNEAKIKFTAETEEFTKNIENAEGSMKALRSELKLNQTQMAGVDDTTELLQERQALLRKEIEASQQKIDALNGKFSKAKEVLGENSKEANQLAVDINYAQNAQLKMQQELDRVNKKLQEQKDAANQSKTALQSLTDKISDQEEKLRTLREKYQNVVLEQGKNSSEAKSLRKEMSSLNDELIDNKKTLDNAENASKKYSNAIEDAGEKSEKASNDGFTVMKGVLSQLIHDGINKAIEGLKNLGSKVVETAAKADDILTKSAVTGLSTDMLQELDYAADYIDTEVDTITGTMTKLNKNMTSSSKDVGAAFNTLGISVRDTNGQLRDDETVYWEVIDALGKVTNETERDNIAMQLLGKSAQDLNPLIEAGSGTMKNLAAEAHNMGYVMDSDALTSLGAFDDMTHQIEDMGTSFIQDIVTSFMGMVDTEDVINGVAAGFETLKTGIMNTVTWTKEAITWMKEHKNLLAGLAIVLGSVTAGIVAYNISQGVKAAMDAAETTSLWGLVTAQWAANSAMFACPITWIVAAIVALIAIIVLLVLNWDKVTEAVSKLWDKIVELFSNFGSWVKEKIVDPVSNFFVGMWTGIKNGASDAWVGIKNTFSAVGSFFKNIFTDAWTSVKNVFSTGGKIFDGIKEGIAEAFKVIVNGIIRGINKVVSVPFNSINTAISKLRGINIAGIKPFTWLSKINVPQIPLLRNGAMLYGPTLNIAGEAGPEAVLPLNHNSLQPLAELLVAGIQGILGIGSNSAILDRLNAIEEAIYDTGDVYLDGVKVSKGLAKPSDEVSGRRQSLTDRGVLV